MSENDFLKLLHNLNTNKVGGPDELKIFIHKEENLKGVTRERKKRIHKTKIGWSVMFSGPD